MSVIQSIRDKGAKISVVLIALSLVGFILMDAFTGRSNLFGGNSTTIGSVNGKKIDYTDFNKKYIAETDYRQQQGYPMDDRGRQQVNEGIWNQEITRVLAEEEFDRLGISMGKNEINDILFGDNPPQDLKQRFTDPKTNQYDVNQAKQFMLQWKRSKAESDRQQLASYVTSLEYNRMMEKYGSLLTNSVNIPKWFVEKQNTENSQIAKISYVKVPYTTIPDSAVKVTDADIADYISKHKEEFKQDDETRSIEYVSFNAGPNHADSAAVREKLESLKQEFKDAQDIKTFIAKSGGEKPYYDGYKNAKSMEQQADKDSVIHTPVGSVYGPYLDANAYAIAKMVAEKQWPDTVKVRHILVGTQQQNQQGQWVPMRDDSTAKKLADSIELAIKNGASFDTLLLKYSDDGSKDRGGIYDNVVPGAMVGAFNDFIFDNKVGDRAVVKTEFGYHYTEILSQKGSSPAYKIAYVTKSIYPSSATDDSVINAANQFAGNSQDQKSFDDNFEKNLKPKGLNKLLASDIKASDATINQVLVSRTLVKAIFDAKKGATIQPLHVGDNYIVATVTDINPAGTQSVSKARPLVETILSKKKKAQQLIQKIGKVGTLDAVATAIDQPVQSLDSLRMSGGNNFGYEPRVIGAAFNAANSGKVVPDAIEGSEGVFALRVESVSATSVANANIDEQRKQLSQTLKQRQGFPTQILMKTAAIKDNRAKFF